MPLCTIIELEIYFTLKMRMLYIIWTKFSVGRLLPIPVVQDSELCKSFWEIFELRRFREKKNPLFFPCLITFTYKFGPFLFLNYMSNIFCCKNYLDNGFLFSIRNAKFESDMIWNEMSSKKTFLQNLFSWNNVGISI